MRMLLVIVGGLCLLSGCGSRHAGDTRDTGIRCTVIEYVDEFYAVWGRREDGSPWEDRCHAIRVRVDLPGGTREVFFFQHKLARNVNEYPPVGAHFAIAELPRRKNPLATNREHYDFNDLRITSE